jgi:spermidine synthase
MQIDVKAPVGESGPWAIEEFVVTDAQAALHNVRCNIKRQNSRMIVAGRYKRLVRGNGTFRQTVMSNTPAEIADHERFFKVAKGRVLMAGLGLGVSLEAILTQPGNEELITVTVIELSDDVIKLVGPTFEKDERVSIIHADIFEWEPPKGIVYDAAWFDIWDDICSDNLKEMNKLHRKYRKKALWHDSWCRWECKHY